MKTKYLPKCNNALPSIFYLLIKTTYMKTRITKILGVIIITLLSVFNANAQDLTFGSADITTYANAAAASTLKTGAGITISQIGTQGVTGTPNYVQLNNSNGTPVLNSTSNDAITITSTTAAIDHIVITYASNTAGSAATPYVGYNATSTAMGSASVSISSCEMQAGNSTTTHTAFTYTPPSGTYFAILVRGKACSPSASSSVTIRISQIDVYLAANCTAPSISVHPSGSTQTLCQNATPTNLSITASGTGLTYQWYSNTTASNTGGTSVGSANGGQTATYTPSTASVGTLYYYCIASTGTGCNTTSNVSGAITVNSGASPTFTTTPFATTPLNSSVTYTTQGGNTNYIWSVPGTLNVDYSITSGGISSTDNTVTLTWLTAGSKTVTVGYSSNGCASASPASNTTTVSSSVFYNKPNTDVTFVSNWGTNTDGTGSAPSNFTDAGQTFFLYNNGATMSTSWSVQGAGSVLAIGDGTNALTFNATQTFDATILRVRNNATLRIHSSTIPTFETLFSGSTVDYAGTSQSVTPTSYSNLTISGTGTTFSGTTNISGVFTPGAATASSGTIVLNGTSNSQIIPAFSYNNLTIAGGVNGKQTNGNISVAGVLTMNNSFTVVNGSAFTLGSTASMTSVASTTLTVNGTFEIQQNSVTFNAGSGSITVAAGGTFKMSGTVPNNALAFTNVNFTTGIGAAGSTLYLATLGCPRLPSSTFSGNVTYDLQTSTGTVNILNTTPINITGNMNIIGTGGVIITQASGGSPRSLVVSGNLNMSGAARFDVSANGSTGACALTVNGNINIAGSNDTLYTSNTSSTGGTGTINVLGNLNHTAGVLGRSSTSAASGTIAFTGTGASQDISTIGITSNTNVTLNNTNGARLLTNLFVGSTLTLTSGKLRTNGFSVVMTGTTSTISGPSFGALATSYIAVCDAGGTTSTTGGLTIQSIGTSGRTTAVTFPVGPNTTSYNPVTVTNSSTAVDYTVRVNTTAFAGTTSDSTVQRTWNIQPASGTPSSIIGLQWNGTGEGTHFVRTSASVAHYNTGTSSVDVSSPAGAASGTDPYTLTSGATAFTIFGDFGLIPGVIVPAVEPTVQVSAVSVTPANTTMSINWTPGDGTNSIVLIKQATVVNGSPVDGISYTDGGAVFGSGSQIGTGNYVVYTGTGSSVTVTGLTTGTTYYVAVFSFNGNNGTENYLTTTAATTNGTTTTPTYYYVGGAGSSSNTFATANMWATSLNGTPLAAFTPSNTDVFVFDGSNLGGGYTDSVTIAPISSTTTLGKLILLNNAKVNIVAGGTRTMNIGNSAYSTNTTVISVPSGSKLYISGSATAINLASNSSANISGSFYLGNGSGNSTLIPNASGSFVTVNNGAYFETNLSSSSTNPFGSSGTNLVTFASGATYKHTKASDVFGGAGASVVSFSSGSTFWYANTSNSTAQTLSGRSFGNVIVEANWSPSAGSAGFTMYNYSMPTSGYTLTIAETGANNHLKGNVNIANGATLKFNPGSTSTLYFSGTTLQTITNNGTWSINSTNINTGNDQNFVVSNTAGVAYAGTGTTGIAGLAGTSFTVNNGCNLEMSSGSLNLQGGTLILNGTISRTSGNIIGVTTGSTVNITGLSSLPSNIFRNDSIRILTINRPSGLSLSGDIKVVTTLNLTSGVVSTGSNNLILLAGATVVKGTGWVNGNLRKNVSTGSNVARTFEIGDATNYTPVSLVFSSVSTAGDLSLKTVGAISSQSNIATAPVSTSAYINRYWSLSSVNTLTFTNYKANFNFVASDIVGGATSSSVVMAKYLSSWTKSTPISIATYTDSVNNLTSFGDVILANDCITVTPTISINSTSTTFCTGSSATFTANITNGGSSPSYQWKRNSNNIGTNSNTLTLFDTDVTNGDVITCVLTSNNVCQTAATTTSNGLTLIVGGTVTPSISISTASNTVCSGSNVNFSANATNGGTAPVYQWKRNNANVAVGSSVTFLAGTLNDGDIISCVLTANNICQTTATAFSNSIQLTVIPSPSIQPIKNSAGTTITSTTMCNIGSILRYYCSTQNGVWSSNSPGIASVDNKGIITANSNGLATISYSITSVNGCVSSSSLDVRVAQEATPNPISGVNSICVGNTTSLATSSTGGVWSSVNNRGTINLSGVFTGVNAGAGEVRYTTTNVYSCSAYVSYPVTVNAIPNIPTINYASGTTNPQSGAPSGSFCVGRVFTVVGTPSGGAWTSTGVASITNGGIVTINAVGAGSIKYTYTTPAGCFSSRTIGGSGYSCAARGVVGDSQSSMVNSQWTMYPNPAKSFLNINVETLVGNGNIVITDLYGKTIRTQNLSMGTNTINIANLSKGLYFVSTITNEGKTTKKLVVE